MRQLFTKVLCVLSIYSFLIVQSYSAEEIILHEGMRRTIDNFTISCIANSTAAAEAVEASIDYSKIVVAGLLGTLGGACFGPCLKTLYDPLCNAARESCGVPRCCRCYSSSDMDIEIDLLKPAWNSCEAWDYCGCCSSRGDMEVLKALDAALGAEGSGYNKYALINDDSEVVGYQYDLDTISIALVKDYKGTKCGKGLLKFNSDIGPDKKRDVGDFEKKLRDEVEQEDDEKGDAHVLPMGKQNVVGNGQRKKPAAYQTKFQENLLNIIKNENVKYWVEKTLDLHKKSESEWKVSKYSSFFCFDIKLSGSNFLLYFEVNPEN